MNSRSQPDNEDWLLTAFAQVRRRFMLVGCGGRNWVRTSDPSLVRELSYPDLTRYNAVLWDDLGAYRA